MNNPDLWLQTPDLQMWYQGTKQAWLQQYRSLNKVQRQLARCQRSNLPASGLPPTTHQTCLSMSVCLFVCPGIFEVDQVVRWWPTYTRIHWNDPSVGHGCLHYYGRAVCSSWTSMPLHLRQRNAGYWILILVCQPIFHLHLIHMSYVNVIYVIHVQYFRFFPKPVSDCFYCLLHGWGAFACYGSTSVSASQTE